MVSQYISNQLLESPKSQKRSGWFGRQVLTKRGQTVGSVLVLVMLEVVRALLLVLIQRKNSDFFDSKMSSFEIKFYNRKIIRSVYYHKFIQTDMDFRLQVRISGQFHFFFHEAHASKIRKQKFLHQKCAHASTYILDILVDEIQRFQKVHSYKGS